MPRPRAEGLGADRQEDSVAAVQDVVIASPAVQRNFRILGFELFDALDMAQHDADAMRREIEFAIPVRSDVPSNERPAPGQPNTSIGATA